MARLSREYSNAYGNAGRGQQPSPAERLVEPVGGLSLLGRTDVAVDVRGDGVRRVAQVLLDDRGVRAGRQGKLAAESRRVCRVTLRRPARCARTSKRRSASRGSSGVPISVVVSRPSAVEART